MLDFLFRRFPMAKPWRVAGKPKTNITLNNSQRSLLCSPLADRIGKLRHGKGQRLAGTFGTEIRGDVGGAIEIVRGRGFHLADRGFAVKDPHAVAFVSLA